ncbi:MAG: metallophosphoesterase [Ilumatobacteraceae bacterium]|nr:metallophosphoesterase [Ilumatobacteraceae bacterium]
MSTHTIRTDLGATSASDDGECLLSLVHLTDMHVLDAGSPARAEWVELEAHDPFWRPLLHMHRPYDALTTFALDAHVRAIAADPVGPTTSRAFDIAVSSGDNIDNAQRNELDAYLALVAGGTAILSSRGSAQDPSSAAFHGTWPYWSPDASVEDAWRSLGYPAVDDFVARTSAPITSSGLGIPWTSVPGNHDLMIQGTALPNPRIERIATAAAKSLRRPDGFAPDDPLASYLLEPERFSAGPTFAIEADQDRRAIDRGEWIRAHIGAGALGYSPTNATDERIDTVIDLDHVRLILLDTNHPDGDYQGSIGLDQLAWLEERLGEVESTSGRLAVLVSHHGADSLVNRLGARSDRVLGPALLDVVHRHPCVVAWLVGHRHVNRIEPRHGAGGGFWEITTASVIDWPSQTRSVELVRHRDGSVEIVCTMLDHRDPPEGLASLHRQLARRFASTGVATRMTGRAVDGNVRLQLPVR